MGHRPSRCNGCNKRPRVANDVRRERAADSRRAVSLSEALFLQDAREGLLHLSVEGRDDIVEIFDDGDFRTEAIVDAAQFQADIAAADDDHALRHRFQGKGAP